MTISRQVEDIHIEGIDHVLEYVSKSRVQETTKGTDRNQIIFSTLSDQVDSDSWARIVDLFVDAMPTLLTSRPTPISV